MLAHMVLANVAGHELICTEDEALRIATAWVGFRRHYGGMGFDPKHQAIAALAIAVVSVEAPKLRNRMARRKAEAEAEQVNEAARNLAPGGTVVPLNPAHGHEGGRAHPDTGFPRPHG